MWVLKGPSGHCVYLVNGQSVTIGRNPQEQEQEPQQDPRQQDPRQHHSADHQIAVTAAEDKSVSRKHVTVFAKAGHLYCKDLNSRYGTFLNGDQIDPDEDVRLADGDTLTPGRLACAWTLHRMDLVTCFSAIAAPGPDLPPFVRKLAEWTDKCTHLTMNRLELTDKAIAALAHGKRIVSPDFWKACAESVVDQKALPEEAGFLPEPAEASLDYRSLDFGPVARRAELFEGKRFIFLDKKQMDRHERTIIAAGGKCSRSGKTPKKSDLKNKNAVVIRPRADGPSSKSGDDLVEKVTAVLAEDDLRLIPEAEIALAILHCSLEKFCNPGFTFASVFAKKSNADAFDGAEMIAPETEEIPIAPFEECSRKRTADDRSDSPERKKLRSADETVDPTGRSDLRRDSADGGLFDFLPEDERDSAGRTPIETPPTGRRPRRARSPKTEEESPPAKKFQCDPSPAAASGCADADDRWITCVKTERVEDDAPRSLSDFEEKFGELAIIIPKKMRFDDPPPTPASTSFGGVNFKRFRKVHPIFRDGGFSDFKLSICEDVVDADRDASLETESSDDEREKSCIERYAGIPRRDSGRRVRRL